MKLTVEFIGFVNESFRYGNKPNDVDIINGRLYRFDSWETYIEFCRLFKF